MSVADPTSQIAKLICGWQKYPPYNADQSIRIEEVNLLIVCEYSLEQVRRPCRTQDCMRKCMVERRVLVQTEKCTCGREVDAENPIVQDLQFRHIVSLIRDMFGGQVKSVVLNLKNMTVRPEKES